MSRLAIRTVGDLAQTPPAVLERLLGEAAAQHLTELAHGVDDRDVIPYEAPKSIGHEETFERDLDDVDEIVRELLHLSGRVAARLRDDGYRARTVTLKVRLANFTTLTRSRTLPDATDVGADLYHIVAELYRGLPGAGRRVRLLGVQASGLQAAGRRAARVAARRAVGRRRAQRSTASSAGSGKALRRRRPSWTAGTSGCSRPNRNRRGRKNPSRQPQVLPIIVDEGRVPRRPEGSMPLSDHEQRILEEIERRLAEDDPAFVEQVGRTDLYTHLARRIRLSSIAFCIGLVMIMLFVWSVVVAAIGFVVTVLSAVMLYRYVGQLGRDQLRMMQDEGFTLSGLLGRIAARFRRP